MKPNDIFNIDESMMDEGWKDALAGGALAAGLAFGGGAAHAQSAPVDAPAMTAPAGSLSSRYTQGIDFSSTPYTINANGKEYKFAGRDADAPSKGQSVTVPAALIGIRGLRPTNVILANDGKYYIAPADANESRLNEVNPHNYDSDEDYYAALNAPAKRRSAPSDYPYSQEDDEAYFREIWRKKREAAKKAEQDKEQGVAEGSENILPRGTSVTVLHKGKQVPGKIVRYDAGKNGYSNAYVVDVGGYESIFVPASKIQTQGVAEDESQPTKYRATVEYGPTAADAHFVTVTASSTEEAEAKVAAWCKKKGVRNPMITINGADKPVAEDEGGSHAPGTGKWLAMYWDGVQGQPTGQREFATREEAVAALNKLPKNFAKAVRPVTGTDMNEAEGTPSGMEHLNKEVIKHIIQQAGTEGAHAIIKSLGWGDGAATELLALIVKDLKQDIGMDECSVPNYAAMYESKLMEMGAGSIATSIAAPTASAGTLFGGSYSQKNSPFKKNKPKKSGMIKR